MAPSSGHILIPKVLRIFKSGTSKITSLIRSKLPTSTLGGNASLQPIRVYANQPVHPLAFLKQSRAQSNNRWFSTTTRTFTSSAKPSGPRYDRSKFPISKISRAISQKGAVPFASTLRPNLTGGALPRSAGGYSLGGGGQGARHFSHTPGAQAQVIQNVSAGIRAFFIGGGKARFDGVDAMTGEKRFRSVSHTEDAVYTKWESSMASMKGTNLEFKLSPAITALCPSFSTLQTQDSKTEITSLNSIGLLDNLASDFARALKDLSLILADLRRLSAFGDLPISLATTDSGPILRVRFPGSDADLVCRLCDEVGVRRGVITEDEGWAEGGEKDVEMALLFPFAPSTAPSVVSEDEGGAYYFDENPFQQERMEWRGMISPSTRGQSLHDNTSFEDLAATLKSPVINANRSYSPSGYESLRDSDFASDDPYYQPLSSLNASSHQSYEGVEGIYKFLQVCEDSRR
ncbi:hypothetical protein P7C71_g295, partial [Lecanoromycetidae sp. Uapishka_2]